MLKFNENGYLSENSYEMAKDAVRASLFTVGNGYIGIRGSFEEYSTLAVQGAYIRGLIDEIIEICTPVPDNDYMKNHYFDEEGLKRFEKTDCCVNFADIMTVRIEIGGKEFSMWRGGVVSYERVMDTSRGETVRTVVFDDGENNRTELVFRRFASFENDHIIGQKVTVTPINHSLPIRIISGVDLRTKTNGQYITEKISETVQGNRIAVKSRAVKKYGFTYDIGVVSEIYVAGKKLTDMSRYPGNDIVACEQTVNLTEGDTVTLEKIICVATSRDGDIDVPLLLEVPYGEREAAHLRAYEELFTQAEIKIEGDFEAGSAGKYCVYQTLISACRNDSVHGIGAKGLTGEKYHQYVWWDSEIYQMPFFLYSRPETAKNTLLYRYATLEQAKRNAREQGYEGARYAFCSSVTGEECVWSFSRHPFMQDHISADVAYAVLSYYHATADRDFMREAGFEILFECLKYWLSRATKTARGYEILRVTGPDEHHPDVNNDAYTNYLTAYIARTAVEEYEDAKKWFDFKAIGVGAETVRALAKFAKELYLPVLANGLIPQFDGYFDLLRGIEQAGGNTGVQMKYNGLYHRSQFIKQPDVMLLYTYLDIGIDKSNYPYNWDYYESMCESSSSLSYAPHAVASADNKRPLSFVSYFFKTVKIDIENLHGGTEEGLHSGCIAGGWIAVLRGVFGVRARKDALYIEPNFVPLWKKVSMRIVYRGARLEISLEGKKLKIKNPGGAKIDAVICGRRIELGGEYESTISG